jgi:diguanylate cyclase (GGDEF)-like protein/PAS domain S-box-containing protein
MLAVAVVSIAGLVLNDAASVALDAANQIDVQVATLTAHVHDVALNGTAFLVDHAVDEGTALAVAGQRVDGDLALLDASREVSPAAADLVDTVLLAWHGTGAARQAVGTSAPGGLTANVSRITLEDSLNAQLTVVSVQLKKLDDLNAAEVAVRHDQRNAAQVESAIAIAVAILVGLVGAVWLLRQLRERQVAVRRREDRLSALVQNASDGILVVDSERRLAFATPSFKAEFVDHLPDGPGLAGMLHPDDQGHTGKAWERVTAGGADTVCEVEARLLRSDGEWRHVWAKLTNRLSDPAVEGIVINVTDVSERHEFEQRLTHQALHDALTGLPNRDFLNHRMARAVASSSAERVSVLYVDCDDFKRVNDTLSHAVGDHFLTAVGGVLLDCVRPEDTVARLGGDEFAVLLENTGADGAVLAAERIIRAMGAPFLVDGKDAHRSVSIGVASGERGALHPETLLADADLAMHFAKRAGKGGLCVFTNAMRTEQVDRLELGEDLRSAVEAGGLSVVYQPIVDLKSGTIIGAEALARWQHSSRGWVGPDTFIPLAEELGLVERIDQWVLREACSQAQRWTKDRLPHFRMAVNLSGRDLQQPDLVDLIARILRDSGFPPGQLELELTEGVAINEASGAQKTLNALKTVGVQLAIDDFGTGYSALSRLRGLPFDRLKIDKAFVDDIGSLEQAPMLVDTILDMAHVLGLEVVAEGVENGVQAEYLRDRRCDNAQGYFFHRPMSAAELGALLKDQAPEITVTASPLRTPVTP